MAQNDFGDLSEICSSDLILSHLYSSARQPFQGVWICIPAIRLPRT